MVLAYDAYESERDRIKNLEETVQMLVEAERERQELEQNREILDEIKKDEEHQRLATT